VKIGCIPVSDVRYITEGTKDPQAPCRSSRVTQVVRPAPNPSPLTSLPISAAAGVDRRKSSEQRGGWQQGHLTHPLPFPSRNPSLPPPPLFLLGNEAMAGGRIHVGGGRIHKNDGRICGLLVVPDQSWWWAVLGRLDSGGSSDGGDG
jgi:hypothetical protein